MRQCDGLRGSVHFGSLSELTGDAGRLWERAQKSQKGGQEDEGSLKQLGRVLPLALLSPLVLLGRPRREARRTREPKKARVGPIVLLPFPAYCWIPTPLGRGGRLPPDKGNVPRTPKALGKEPLPSAPWLSWQREEPTPWKPLKGC